MSVFIALCGRTCNIEIVAGLIQATNYLTKNNIKFEFKLFRNYGLERERNQAVDYFLKSELDYLFFIDSDIMLAEDSIFKLLKQNKNIISGVYVVNKCWVAAVEKWVIGVPKFLTIKDIFDYQNSTIEIKSVGAGCLLIKKEVFLNMHKPWFKFGKKYGEDFMFCEKAVKLGHKIYLDTSVKVNHIKSVIY